MISQTQPFQQLTTSFSTYTDQATRSGQSEAMENKVTKECSESLESLNQFPSVKHLFNIRNATDYCF